MRIEDITAESLEKASEKELYSLRLRFIQLWNKNFLNNDKEEVGSLNRENFLVRYNKLIKELKARELKFSVQEIDQALFSKSMTKHKYGLDITELDDLILVPSFISVVGSFATSFEKAEDIDVVIRQENRDTSMELLIDRALASFTKLDRHFIYYSKGPHGTHIPLYDLVLRCRDKTERVVVKGSEEYYDGLDRWNDIFVADFTTLLKFIDKGDTILDLGCGSGRVMKALINLGHEVEGVDKNEEALKRCRERKLKVCELDLEHEALPYAEDSFDVVLTTHTLEHLANPAKVLQEACRVAKKYILNIIPLGEREDTTHIQLYNTVEDVTKAFGDFIDLSMQSIPEGDNTLLLVIDKTQINKATLEPFDRYTPPKPNMANITEAFKFGDIENWIKDRWPVDVEEKLNGFRAIAEKKGGKVRIWTEGRIDRSKQLPQLMEVLDKIPEDFIIDMSLGIEKDGVALPRIKLMTIMADKPVFGEKEIPVGTCFDLPYWKEDIHTKPLKERRELLQDFYKKYLKSSGNFNLTSYNVAHTKEDVERLYKKLSKLSQSEGIVLKTLTSPWNMDGGTNEWAKLKQEVEIKVEVVKVIPNRAGGYNYYCGVSPGDTDYTNLMEGKHGKLIDLGKTFNTSLKASVGDILTIGVEEIIPDEESHKLQWLGPRVLDMDEERTKPYTANQVIDIARRYNVLQKGIEKKEANIDYKLDDTGRGVLQIHIMGIDEEEMEELKKVAKEAYASRGNLRKLKMILKSAVGDKACHLDFRLVRKGDKYFEGGEIMPGNLSGLDKIEKLMEGSKMRFGWKAPHSEEPTVETIRGSVDWMDAGKGRVEIFEPGSVGAFSNTYAAMILLDEFNWKLIQADEHAKKFEISNSKLLESGVYLIAYVPVGPKERVWMISKLKKLERSMTVVPITKKEDEHIIYGIVYEPNTTDTQGDTATADDIQKACYYFMEHSQVFKVSHGGRGVNVKILENYIAPQNFNIEGRPVYKGSWIMVVRVLDEDVWKLVKEGELQGFSMAGYADVTELD